jgi:hypothetical protein
MEKREFYRWLNTARNEELTARKAAIIELSETLTDEAVRRQAQWMIREIEMESLARTEVARVSAHK